MGGCCLICDDPGAVGQVLPEVSLLPKDRLIWDCLEVQFLRCKSRVITLVKRKIYVPVVEPQEELSILFIN